MPRKKVQYEVKLKMHGIMEGDSPEAIKKEVERAADYKFYQTADSVEVEITDIKDLD